MNRKADVSIICLAAAFLATAQSVTGSWEGKLKLGAGTSLRIVLNLDNDGKNVTLDSPDQGAFGIPGEVKYNSGDSLSISVSKIGMDYNGRLNDGTLSGTFMQGPARLPLELTPKTVVMKRPQTPVAPFPYSTEEVTFRNVEGTPDGATLTGTLTIPEKALKNTPVVLMVSGSGQQNRDEELFGHKPFAVIADYLARNGIASLRYDDRGTGGSTGEVADATTYDFAKDAAAGVKWLRDNRKFGRVGVLGHSEGGLIAFMIPSDFIVTLGAPAVRGDSILRYQSEEALVKSGMPPTLAGEYGDALLRLYEAVSQHGSEYAVGNIDKICGWEDDMIHNVFKNNLKKMAQSNNKWINTFASLSPSEYIKKLKNKPALVLYGEKDTQVAPKLNEAPMRAMAPKADVRVYLGLNHLMQHCTTGDVSEYSKIEETISPEVLSDIVEFIKTL